MKCEKDCWKCELEGCPFTLSVSQDIDKDAKESPNITNRQLTLRKYAKSNKRKATQKRYYNSKKGKESNARATRNYYQNHREEILAKQKEKYYANPEMFKKRRREQYLRWKAKREQELKEA